ELEGVATLNAADGQTARWTLHIRYDVTWGRYRYTWDIDVGRTRPTGMEAFNMLVTYALADRLETRRWTHTVIPDAQDRATRVPNSNALFLSHGYWAVRNTTYPRAWVAYAAHP